jgi:hypothetical protein
MFRGTTPPCTRSTLRPENEFQSIRFYATKLVVLCHRQPPTERTLLHSVLDTILRIGISILRGFNF